MRFFRLGNKEKISEITVDGIVKSGTQHVLSLREKIWKIEFSPRKWMEFFLAHRKLLAALSATFIAIIVAIFSLSSSAEVAVFYPTSCLGGWQNPKNAEGAPDLHSDASSEDFTSENSAVLKDSNAEFYCGGFQGAIPKDSFPKTAVLKLSWSVDGGDVNHQKVDASMSSTQSAAPSSEDARATSTDTSETTPPEDKSTDQIPTIDTPIQTPTDTSPVETPPAPDVAPPPAQTESLLPFFSVARAADEAPPVDVPQKEETLVPTENIPDDTSVTTSDITVIDPPKEDTSVTTDTTLTPTPVVTDDFMEISYTIDGSNWQSLVRISRSVWKTGEYTLPIDLHAWEDISQFQIKLTPISSIDSPPVVYLDGMSIEVGYEVIVISAEDTPTVKITDPSIDIVAEDLALSSTDSPEFTVTDPNLSKTEIRDLIDEGKAEIVEDKAGVFTPAPKPEKTLDTIKDLLVLPDLELKKDDTPAPVEEKPTTEDISPPGGGGDGTTGLLYQQFPSMTNAIQKIAAHDAAIWQLPVQEKSAVSHPNLTSSKKNILKNLLAPHIALAQTVAAPVDVAVFDSGNQETVVQSTVTTSFEGGTPHYHISLKRPREFRPGKFRMQVTLHSNGTNLVSEQDFSWGVLAINIDRSIETPGADAYLQMGVLNDAGHTICDADLDLVISSPTGASYNLTTTDSSIIRESQCGHDNVITVPDYYAHFTVPTDIGTYSLHLTAHTANGDKTINDHFTVQASVPFDVVRSAPTRTFPEATYPVTLHITPLADWSGTITEKVPDSFTVTPPHSSVAYDTVESIGDAKVISWNVSLHAGQETLLGYYFKGPLVSPEFFLTGPLTFTESGTIVFKEARQWQIASDGLNLYWVGGTANWDATAGTKWATCSGCPGGAGVPTAADNVFFDGNSGVSTVTISAAATTLDLDFTGFTGTLAAGSSTLAISGSLTIAAGMTYSYSGGITFNATDARTIRTNGKTHASALTFNGTGGSWTLQDALTTTGATLTLTAGTIDTGSFALSLAAFISSGVVARTLTLGSSTVTITGAWNISGSNYTLNAGTSSITDSMSAATFAGGNLTYYDLTFTGSSAKTLAGSNTFHNLTVTGTAAKTDALYISGTQTVTNIFNATGNSATNRLLIIGTPTGSFGTVSVATSVSLSNVDFLDIIAAGAAAPFTGTSIGDCGGLTSITGTPAVTRYWVAAAGTSTGNWSDITHWSSSSGGSGSSTMPLCQDTANINASSIDAGSRTITADEPRMGTIDFTGATNTPTFAMGGQGMYGSVTLISSMTLTGAVTFFTRSTGTITSNGKAFPGAVTIDAAAGTIQAADAFSDTGQTLTVTTGTFNANNQNVTVGLFSSAGSSTRTITMGSGTWTLDGTGASTLWNTSTTTGLTFTPNTSTIKLSESTGSASAKTFSGGGLTFNNIWVAPAASGSSTYVLTIAGSNTFNDFKDTRTDLTATNKILFTAATTTTVTTFTVSGVDATHKVTLDSTTTATHSLVKAGGGVITRDYLNIQHSVATPMGTWFAGANSTNNQATATAGSGWVFTAGCHATTTGGWNTGANWTGCTGAGGVPAAADSVVIDATKTMTLNSSTGTVYESIVIDGTIDTSGSNYSLKTKNLTISSTGTLTANASTITLSGTSGILFNVVSGGTFTYGTSTVNIATGDVAFTSPNFLTGTTATSFYNLTIGPTLVSARSLTFGNGAVTVNNNFTAQPLHTTAIALTVILGSGGLTVTGLTTLDGTTSSTTTLDTGSGLNYAFSTGSINVTASDSLLIRASTFTITGTSGTLFTRGGTFTAAVGSTTVFNGNGAATLTSNTTFSFDNLTLSPTLSADRTYTFGTGALTIAGNFNINPAGTANTLTVTMGAAITVGATKTTTITRTGSNALATLNTNAFVLSTGLLDLETGGTYTSGSTTTAITGTGTVFTNNGGTFTTGTGTLNLSNTAATTKTFAGGGSTFNNVTFAGSTGGGSYIITGANTFATLADTGTIAHSITFPAGVTTTVTGLTVSGVSTATKITLQSSSPGSAWTISKSSGYIDRDYLNIQDSTATGGALFYAGVHSTSVSGNTGWTFTGAGIYWVGGTGNWNDPTNHWALSSGGTPGVNNTPTALDNCIFDTNSSTANAAYTVTVNASAVCKDFTMDGPHPSDTNKVTWAGSSALAIWGDLNLTGTSLGITRTYTGVITFSSINTQTISVGGATNPVTMASNLIFNGVGGSWTFQDTFNNGTGTCTLTNGTVDTNGKTITVGSISSSNSNTRTLTLGASTVNIGTNGTVWDFGTTTGLTFNANTSTIIFTAAGTLAGGGKTFNNVTFNGAGLTKGITGANTFNNLTVTGTAVKTDGIAIAANQVVSGTFTVTGNSVTNRVLVYSQISGTAYSITAAAETISNVDFLDITGAGAAAPFTGTSIGDCGNNSSITGDTPVTRYWVKGAAANSSGNWSDTTHWATSSGAGTGAATVPLCQDTVLIDSGSIDAGSRTITADMPRMGKDISFSGATNTPTVAFSSTANTIYGSLTLISAMTISGTQITTFAARTSATITSNTKILTQPVTIDSGGGTISLADAFDDTGTAATTFTLTTGTFNANNQNVKLGLFASNNSNTRALTMGSGTWSITANTAVTAWNITTTTGMTLTPGTSTIKLTESTGSATAKTFAGGGLTYNSIWFTTALSGSSTCVWTISGNNTFNDFKDDRTNLTATNKILFTAASTQTVTTFTVSGVDGTHMVTLDSTTTATYALVKLGGGVIDRNFLNIQHSVATPASTWYAGTGSTNNQATATAGSGWTFTAAPTNCVATTTGNGKIADNTDAHWTGCSGVGGIPAAADNVTINSGVTITLETNTPTFNRLTIAGTLTTSGTNYSVGTKNLSITSTGTLTANASTITLTGTDGVLFNVLSGGTFTPGTSTVVMNGDAAFTSPNFLTGTAATSFYNLTLSPTITAARTYTFGTGAVTVTNNLDVNAAASGTFLLTVNLGSGGMTVTGSTTVEKNGANSPTALLTTTASNYAFSTGTMVLTTGGTFTANASAVTITGTSGTLITNTTGTWTNPTGGTTTLSGNGSATISSAALNFWNLTNSGTGTKTMVASATTGSLGVVTISNGTLALGAAGTLSLSGSTGTPFPAATGGGLFDATTGTVTYTNNNASGNTTVESSYSYYNLTLSNSSETFVPNGAISVNVAGTFTLSNGTFNTTGSNYALTTGKVSIANAATAILTANESVITLNATSGTLWTRGTAGVFTQGTSTVVVTSASGTPTLLSIATTFHILKINAAATVINAGFAVTTDNVAGNSLWINNGVFNTEGTVVTGGTSGILEIDSGGTLCIGGTTSATTATCDSGATQTTAQLMPTFSTYTFDAASTVIYLANITQTISNTPTYGNLTLKPKVTASRNYQFGGAMTINGNLDINPGTTAFNLAVVPSGTVTVASGKTTTIERTTSATSSYSCRSGTTDYNLSTGFLNIATGGTLDCTSSSAQITLTGTSGTLFTKGGTFTQGTSEVAVTSASGTPTLLSTGTTFHKLTINSTATVINAGAVITFSNTSSANRLYIQAGVLNDEGNSIVGTANGTMFIDAGAALCISGTTSATTATCDSGITQTTASTFPTNYTNGNITLAATSTVYYLADGTQTISATPTYGNLQLIPQLTNNRTYTFGGATTINGDFTINPTRGSAALLTVNPAGTITVATTKTTTISATSSATSTLDLRPVATDYDLSTGNMTIGASGTLDGASAASVVTVAGDWSNAGTFTAGSTEVILNSAATAAVGGGPTTFYKLTITHTAAKEVDFSTNALHIIHVTNLFSVTGNSGQLIKLYSSSNGVKWHFHPTGTSSVDYADVKDGGCETGAISLTTTNSTNSGNNDSCWFPPAVTFAISDNTIGFGTLVSSAARYATGDGLGSSSQTEAHTLSISTNATYGYSILISGSTLTSGGNTVTPIGDTNTASSVGTKQFGLRMTATGGSGAVVAPYDASGFAFDSANLPDVVASAATGDGVTTTYSVRYLANISNTLAPGSYTGTLTYIMVPNF